MTSTDLKNDISTKLKEIEGLDLSILFTSGENYQNWNNMDIEDVQKFVEHIMNFFQDLSNNIDALDTLIFSEIQNLNNFLQNFITQFSSFSQVNPDSVTSQHHASLNQLQNFITHSKNSGVYNEVQFNKMNLSDIQQIKIEAEGIGSDMKELKGEAGDNLDKIKKDLTEKKLIKLSGNFDQRAEESFKEGNFFLVAFFAALFILVILVIYPIFGDFLNILLKGQNFSELEKYLGQIPITILLIFLANIFYSQYSKNKSIGNTYAHKSSVACSLSEYGEQFFDDVNKIKNEEKKDDIIKDIIQFKIQSTEELFRLPLSEKDELKFQASVANNSIGFEKKK